jgi:hypothetical protein
LHRHHFAGNMAKMIEIYLMISIKNEETWADLDLETGTGLIVKL